MRKERHEYSSPVDALVSLAKRLSTYENRYRMMSEELFHKYQHGRLEDSADFVEWSNEYEHYLAIRLEIEKHLRHVACVAARYHQSYTPDERDKDVP